MTDLSACVIHYFVYVCYVHQIHLLAKQNNVNLLNLYSWMSASSFNPVMPFLVLFYS